MKEDYPLALVLIQAVSLMSCAVRRVPRLRWPAVPILVFLAGVLLVPVSVHAQTVVEVAGNVKQKENQKTFTFTLQGAGGAAINGTVRYIIEGVTSSTHPNSG